MPLTSHLSELRTPPAVVRGGAGGAVCHLLLPCLRYNCRSVTVAVYSGRDTPSQVPLQMIAPAEGFLTYLKVGFVAGVVSGVARHTLSTLAIRRAWLAGTRNTLHHSLSSLAQH